MSIQFSDTSTYKGLVQLAERELGYDRGYISGNTERLKQFTADVNVSWDEFMYLASEADGTWQFDDSNHTDYNIIYMNLVSGQRDYSWTSDESGNLILDIDKVSILESATDTTYTEIIPIDQQRRGLVEGISEESTDTGVPYQYDKTANAVFLDPIPSYSATKGLKLWINRESSYFTYTDTTKKPGVDGRVQEWFYKRPSYEEAKRKSLANRDILARDIELLKERIRQIYSRRANDERYIMTPKRIKYI